MKYACLAALLSLAACANIDPVANCATAHDAVAKAQTAVAAATVIAAANPASATAHQAVIAANAALAAATSVQAGICLQ